MKYVLIVLVPAAAGLAWLYVPFTTFILTGVSNSVNLTDGLDGLAAGLSAIAIVTFALFAYVMGRVDASAHLYCSTCAAPGSSPCTAWRSPGRASAFSGTTRTRHRSSWETRGRSRWAVRSGRSPSCSRASSSCSSSAASSPMETMSVIIQRVAFKIRKRRHGLEYAQKHRVFLRAPLHHHFELKGWKETQVVVRFWILGILCAFVALTTLKLR